MAPAAVDAEQQLLTLQNFSPYELVVLPAKGWIRVLELYSGSGALACSLRCERIEDVALRYEALSYVWGSEEPSNSVEIQCGDGVLSVGPNLACALMHIRYELEPRLLWVDAVCINQSDDEERSQQVQQMGNIFASAKRVLIWIGEDHASQASECFALVDETTDYLTDMLLHYKDLDQVPPISYNDGSISADSHKWDLVRQLMHAEWFERVWVLQEIGLARSATIFHGKSSLEWSRLIELMLHVAYRADVAQHTGELRSSIIREVFMDIWCSFRNADTWRNEMPLTRSKNHGNRAQSFGHILNVARPYRATDQRDHIYAFLNHPRAFSPIGKKKPIVLADYNRSVDEVYLHTAICLVEADQHPWTVLSCVDHRVDSPSLSGQRPSWVPRWDEGWSVYWMGYRMWYQAGGDPSEYFLAKVSKDIPMLEVRAVVFDKIVWASQVFEYEGLDISKQEKEAPMHYLWGELERHDPNTTYVSSGEDREYAFSLTVVTGRAFYDRHYEVNPNLHQSTYQAYKDRIRRSESNATSIATQDDVKGHRLSRAVKKRMDYFIDGQRWALHKRRVFLTSKGYYGVGHNSLELGDDCAVFRGANLPFIIRRTLPAATSELSGYVLNTYKLVGESYIQGIMKGEVLEMLHNGDDRNKGNEVTEQMIAII